MTSSQLTRAYAQVLALVGRELFGRFAPYDDAVDYLGPEKLTKIKALQPACSYARRVWGVDLNFAAWVHDRLYSIGGDEAFRCWADSVFRCIMIWLIEQVSGWFAELRQARARIRAELYFFLVRDCGHLFFTYRKP